MLCLNMLKYCSFNFCVDGGDYGLDEKDMDASVATVQSLCEQIEADLILLRERTESGGKIRDYLIRRPYGVLAHGSLIFIPKKGQPKYILFVVNKPDSHGGGLDWTKICEKSSKVITFIDLAGHEKYLKTTVFGMTGHMPDFCMLMVGSNAGIVGMTKEHLGLALALNVPVFVVVTKIDMCPANILQGKETFFSMNGNPDIPRLRDILQLILGNPKESPGHTGYIYISGTTLRGLIRLNDTLLLGPDPLGIFIPIAVKSIHRKRMPVKEVHGGQTASFALKKIKRSSIRKGMVMVSPKLMPQATWEFEAEILVLHHPTTISPRYQAMVHCGSIRQTATILTMNKDCLRTGDKASVHFRFIKTPEYLHCDQKLVFREGRTKAVGTITKLLQSVSTQAAKCQQLKSLASKKPSKEGTTGNEDAGSTARSQSPTTLVSHQSLASAPYYSDRGGEEGGLQRQQLDVVLARYKKRRESEQISTDAASGCISMISKTSRVRAG
uniref:GTP-binding protein 1 n=1 Tax=Fundulus heteroclitus TaxID=8078 RepID=A0A3Q2QMC4_FUNHE